MVPDVLPAALAPAPPELLPEWHPKVNAARHASAAIRPTTRPVRLVSVMRHRSIPVWRDANAAGGFDKAGRVLTMSAFIARRRSSHGLRSEKERQVHLRPLDPGQPRPRPVRRAG